MHKKLKILIKNADFVVTLNENRDIYENCSILIVGNKIVQCPTKVTKADKIIDARGKIVFPGFINAHHHFFQTTFRFVNEMQNAPLDRWVQILAKHSDNFNKKDWYNCSMTSMAELILSGCTTTSDHCYLIPNNNNKFFDEEIKAAETIGMRFHPVRGSMSLSSEKGNVFPINVCQDLSVVLEEIQRVINKYHDPSFDSMCRIAAGPCFPVFPISTSEEEMIKIVDLCRKNNIRFHTHIAEEIIEFEYTVKKHGKTPIEYLESINCLGEDVWLAHCTFLSENDIKILKKTKTSIVSCPSANSRGAGISRTTELLQAGIPVGIGVDGAAGNDTSNILSELRMLRTLEGAREGVLASFLINHKEMKSEFANDFKGISYLKIERLLETATLHGAKCLGREKEIGSIESGKLADVVIFKDDDISHAGAVNRVGAIFSCNPLRVWCSIINGKIVVEKSKLISANEKEIIKNQRVTTNRVINSFV